MHPFGQDLRYGARLLAKAPAFTVVALLTLALGMGAFTAMFSVVDAVLLKPLPFREAERLLVIWEKNPTQNRYRMFVAPANFLAWQKQGRALQRMAALTRRNSRSSASPPACSRCSAWRPRLGARSGPTKTSRAEPTLLC